MICNKQELKEYLMQDALANGRNDIRPKLFGDKIWKSIVCLRKHEYYLSFSKTKSKLYFLLILFNKIHRSHYFDKCGYNLPPNVFGKGLSIAHTGTIVVNHRALVGNNCRIHEGVTIGATNGSSEAPRIGNNVFIASGAKIIGNIDIADDVCIGANAVVVKSIIEPGTTWGGGTGEKDFEQQFPFQFKWFVEARRLAYI